MNETINKKFNMNKREIQSIVSKCLRKYLTENIKPLLNETHAVRMWHYTSISQGLSIISEDKFRLQQNDDINDDGKTYHPITKKWENEYGEICKPPKYMLCATRIRDSRVGFSSSFRYAYEKGSGGFCRIELDEDAIEHNPSITVRSESDCVQSKSHIDSYNVKKWNYKDNYGWVTPNWENQHEERILSKESSINNAFKYIRRIDFLVKNKEEIDAIKSILNTRRNFINKVFVYSKINDFNSANENYINLFAINETVSPKDINYMIDGDNIVFTNNNGDEVGGISFNCSIFDGIYSEYSNSVEDFNSNIMRKFSYNYPIVNIEDIWVSRNFQGQGYFRKILFIGLNLLSQKYKQFILRACSDNGFPEDKLVKIYQDFGFIPYQETDEDGTIMYRLI